MLKHSSACDLVTGASSAADAASPSQSAKAKQSATVNRCTVKTDSLPQVMSAWVSHSATLSPSFVRSREHGEFLAFTRAPNSPK